MARRAGAAIEKAHKDVISATMAPIICGVSPWESPYTLWRRIKGLEPPREQTLPMWLGTQMEPIVARLFMRETGMKIKRPHKVFDPNFWYTTEEYGFPMGALLDGVTPPEGPFCVWEGKTASGWQAGEWADELPLGYYFQVQHQLAVTGYARCYVAALIGGNIFKHPIVERDDEVIAMITDKERDFWFNHVVANVPPDADGHEATSNAIKAQWAHSTPDYSEVIDDPEIERLAQVYVAQGQSIKSLENERDATGNQLRLVLEDRESVVSGAYKISAKEQIARRLDTTALKAAHVEIAERFMKESSSRPLRVTERKS